MTKKSAVVAEMTVFDAEPVMCGVCNKQEATHQISVSVQRGLEYNHHKRLYHVDYSVCGACAHEAVTVTLGASLNIRRGPGR